VLRPNEVPGNIRPNQEFEQSWSEPVQRNALSGAPHGAARAALRTGRDARVPLQPVVGLRLFLVGLKLKNPDFLEPVLHERRPHRHRMFCAPQTKGVPALGKEMDLRLDARVI
jgi:hypothetical protein